MKLYLTETRESIRGTPEDLWTTLSLLSLWQLELHISTRLGTCTWETCSG